MKRLVVVLVLLLVGCAWTIDHKTRCGIIKPKALWCRTLF